MFTLLRLQFKTAGFQPRNTCWTFIILQVSTCLHLTSSYDTINSPSTIISTYKKLSSWQAMETHRAVIRRGFHICYIIGSKQAVRLSALGPTGRLLLPGRFLANISLGIETVIFRLLMQRLYQLRYQVKILSIRWRETFHWADNKSDGVKWSQPQDTTSPFMFARHWARVLAIHTEYTREFCRVPTDTRGYYYCYGQRSLRFYVTSWLITVS